MNVIFFKALNILCNLFHDENKIWFEFLVSFLRFPRIRSVYYDGRSNG
jgi:hypothetical protein